MSHMNISLYMIVNTSISMSKGKICSQVAHCMADVIRYYISSNIKNEKNMYKHWVNSGETVIVLKSTENDLRRILKNSNRSFPIYDAGKTQVESGSLTVAGFTLDTNCEEELNKLKLL